MKKFFIILPSLYFALSSCRKNVTCVCKDADGNVVKEYSFQGSQRKQDEFEGECSRTTVPSNKNGVVVNTPCDIQ